MTDHEMFKRTCAAIWGDEWYPRASKHLGVSVRTIKYWAAGSHEPKAWAPIFLSLLKACEVGMMEILRRQQAIKEFKRAYASLRGR